MGRLMDFDVKFVLDTPEEFNPREHYSGWILPDGPIVVAHWLNRHSRIADAATKLLDIPFEYALDGDDLNAQLIGEGWVRWYSSDLKNDSIFLDGRTDDLNRPFIREAAGFLADQMGLATARIDTRNTIGDMVTNHHVLPINQYVKYGIPTYRSPMQEFRTTGGPLIVTTGSIRSDPFPGPATQLEGTVAQPPNYAPLKEYLEAPPATVLPQSRYERHLTPCDPPDDPAWPHPTDEDSVEALMLRLPHKQQVLCATIAAELVLPIFEDIYPDDVGPRKAIEAAYGWVDGRTDREEAREAAARADESTWTAAVEAPSAHFAAISAVIAADSVALALEVIGDQGIVSAAEAAAYANWMTEQEFYELWWKECRCRLPFTSVGETELLTTGSIRSDPFPGPKTQLEGTERQVVPVHDWLRFQQPCDPPDDPDWPTPTDNNSVLALMRRLPVKQRVFCALVAAELVLPIFEEASPDNDVPREAIAVTYRWLEGQATAEEVRAASHSASITGAAYAASHAAEAAVHAAEAAVGVRGSGAHAYAAGAAANASIAAAFAWEMTRTEFYALWWRECRCRLAFKAVASTELLTTGQPPYEQFKAGLETPGTQVLPVHDWLRYQQPCDPPDDPAWPAPETFEEVWNLLERLPAKQQVICALTAAELVLPIFEEVQPEIEAPRNAIAAGWQWVQGTTGEEAVRAAATAAEQAGGDIQWEGARGKNAGHSAFSASMAASKAADPLDYVVDDAWATNEARLAARGAWNMPETDFYAWWWKECRCRLAFKDVESTELLTTGQPPYYEGLKEHLEHPRATVLPQHSYERHLTPCDPPEDPEWPTPHNATEASALMRRLPVKQMVICALVAAEVVLPIFEEAPIDDYEDAPREAIAVTYRWLEDQASIEEVRAAAFASRAAASYLDPGAVPAATYDALSSAAASASRTAAYAGYAAYAAASTAAHAAADAVHAATAAAFSASTAASVWGMARTEFYELWWKECRCRLAFTDVGEAELLTTGHSPTETVAQPPYYEPLKEYLEQPGPTVLPQRGYERYLTPCDPPDDPNWPTPTNGVETSDLLDRLPLKQRTICALIAVELMLPIYEEVETNSSPRETVEITYRWLEGEASIENVIETSDHALQVAVEYAHDSQTSNDDMDRAISNVADAAYTAADALIPGREAVYTSSYAVSIAALAARQAGWMSVEEFYELWWKECRCRLALIDAPSAELLTTGQPPYYEGLKEHLEHPRATVLPQHSYERHLTPYDPPDDPAWPTPQTYEDLLDLVDGLSPRQQVRCILVAAEFVLPIFEQEYPDDSGPREALEAIRRWVDGQGTIAAVEQAAERASGSVPNAVANLARAAARYAAIYTVHLVEYPQYSVYASSTIETFHFASSAAAEVGWMSREEFYAWWWRECRCHLAFMNAERAELTTGSNPSAPFLDSSLEVKSSPIHGRGIFAKENLNAKSYLGLAFKRIADTDNPDEDFKRTALGAFVNHSADPNVKLVQKGIEFFYVTTKPIEKGEELLLDYKDFPWEGKRTTGSILSDDFPGPETQLEGTERQVVPVHDWARFQQPCDPPDDPAWPTPTNYNSAYNLLVRLPRKQQIICVLTAAEMVLPIFEQEYRDGSPRRAVETSYRWLNGEASIRAVRNAAAIAEETVFITYEEAHVVAGAAATSATKAAHASYAAAHAASFAAGVEGVTLAAWTVQKAAQAWWTTRREFYELWWKECRCRLALKDIAETEILTTGSIRSDTFPGPETQLEGTERQVVPVHDWLRFQQPCDPPDDPGWPTPTYYGNVYQLLVRLPEKQQIICVLTAAEMVLPVFEDAYHDDDSPRRAVETTYRWLNGEANLEAVRDAAAIAQETVFVTVEAASVAADLEDAAAEASAAKAANASYAAAYAVSFAVGTEDVVAPNVPSFEVLEEGVTAVEDAAEAWWTTTREFYELWWKECRCRLALGDVSTAELLTTGNVYFEQPIKRRPRT